MNQTQSSFKTSILNSNYFKSRSRLSDVHHLMGNTNHYYQQILASSQALNTPGSINMMNQTGSSFTNQIQLAYSSSNAVIDARNRSQTAEGVARSRHIRIENGGIEGNKSALDQKREVLLETNEVTQSARYRRPITADARGKGSLRKTHNM